MKTYVKAHRALVWILIWTIIAVPAVPYAAPSQKSVEVDHTGKRDGTTLLRDALRLYEAMEWDRATETFQAALVAGLTADDRAEAYWYLAVLARATDDLKAAEGYMVELLRAKRDFALPKHLLGTDFERLFQAAVARIDRRSPRIKILPIKSVKSNHPIRVTVEIFDDSPIVRAELLYQAPDTNTENHITMKQAGEKQWHGVIPRSATQMVGTLSLRIMAEDEWQNISTQSVTVTISESGNRSIFYFIGGAIVAVSISVFAWVIPSGDGHGDKEPPAASWPNSASPRPPQ